MYCSLGRDAVGVMYGSMGVKCGDACHKQLQVIAHLRCPRGATQRLCLLGLVLPAGSCELGGVGGGE